MGEFLYGVLLAAESVALSGAAFRTEESEVCNGEVLLVEDAEEFLSYGAAGADNCYIHSRCV